MPESRGLKDEILGNEEPKNQEVPIQSTPDRLRFSDEQQKEIVDIIVQDYDSATDARDQKDWGGNAGEEQTWDDKYGRTQWMNLEYILPIIPYDELASSFTIC